MGFLFLSACSPDARTEVDRLNALSYAFHYRNLDSTQCLARRAYDLSAGYPDGRAEALNNLAFASMARMDYGRAAQQLEEAVGSCDNFVELYVAAVQQMRLCQRRSANREFYDYRERADRCLRRINESRASLTPRQQRRMLYAESEYAIVSSAYFYYVGLRQQSVAAIATLADDIELQHDTAQYLNYLYNVGAGGVITANSGEETDQREFESLLKCFFLARQAGCDYFVAQSLEAMSEHLQDTVACERLVGHNYIAIKAICPELDNLRLLAGRLAEASRLLFASYGDVYQTAGAERTLASCYMAIGDYAMAIGILEKSLGEQRVLQAPDLVASIREQLSVAYAAVGNKAASDLNRNVYLDLQDGTRQDRQLEARVDTLERTSRQLNILMALVVLSICALVFLLWLFNHLYRRGQRQYSVERLLQPLRQWQERQAVKAAEAERGMEDMAERRDLALARRTEGLRLCMENKARLSLVEAMVPLIDRMLHEMRQLGNQREDEATRQDRLDYVAALAQRIDDYNAVLTQWIQLRGGQLRLRIETFPLQPLLDIVAKGQPAYREKGVTLTLDTTEARVKADRVLTLFMVNTLADNARKFTPRGGRVHIGVTEGDGYVEVSVADTGCGMPPEVLAGIFDHKTYNGHGFGLMNCRGIIDKYRKVSALFSCCLLAAESKVGEGSRFFFRLPRAARLWLGLAFALSSFMPQGVSAQVGNMHLDTATVKGGPELRMAAAYADSAYYSNIAATYPRTLAFADSCRGWLNRHYLLLHPVGRDLMMSMGDGDHAAELAWLRDSIPTAYDVILDMRNEAAVAALALHRWDVYEYNNKVYTQLYKVLAADNTLPDYCRTMQRSQQNKTVAIVVCVLALLMVLPAYYLLYYRHILHHRLCIDRVNAINAVLQGDESVAVKLERVLPMAVGDYPPQLLEVVQSVVDALRQAVATEGVQASDMADATDQLARADYEASRLYVANATLENSLSTLKHETMYYPSRIAQLAREGEASLVDLRETVDYYHDIFLALSRQAAHQLQGLSILVRPVPASAFARSANSSLFVLADHAQADYLFATLRSLLVDGGGELVAKAVDGSPYVRFTLASPAFKQPELQSASDPFAPSVASIPLLVCRQIVRAHGEATARRGCGLEVRNVADGVRVMVTLPRQVAHHDGGTDPEI